MSIGVPSKCFLCFEFFFASSAHFVQKQKLFRFDNLLIPDKSSVVPARRAHAQTIVARAVPVSMNDKIAMWTTKETVVLVQSQLFVPLEAIAARLRRPSLDSSLAHNYFSSGQKSITNTINKGAQRIRLRDAVRVLLCSRVERNAEIELVKVDFRSDYCVKIFCEICCGRFVLVQNPPLELRAFARETFLQLPLPFRKLTRSLLHEYHFAIIFGKDVFPIQFFALDRISCFRDEVLKFLPLLLVLATPRQPVDVRLKFRQFLQSLFPHLRRRK